MFELSPPPVATSAWLCDGGLGSEVGGPLSDEALERLFAEAEMVLGDVPAWVPDRVPEWLDGAAESGSPWAAGHLEEPVPAYGACSPSGRLALELDRGTADEAELSDESLIEAVVGFDRVASWAAARQARLLAELVRRRPPDPVPDADGVSVGSRFAPDEVGVALKLARGTAAGRIGTACRLLSVLTGTHRLWEEGLIDTAKARAVDEATAVLPDELAAAVEARVLPRAPPQSLAQLRSALARAVIAVDPEGAAARHRAARKDRRVHVQQESDGMASLWALLTATDAAGAYAWLTRLARGLGDDPRSMDERRADLLAELLNGRLPTAVTFVGDDEEPAARTGTDGTGTTTSTDGPGTDGTGTDGPGTDGPGTDGPGTGTATDGTGTGTGTGTGADDAGHRTAAGGIRRDDAPVAGGSSFGGPDPRPVRPIGPGAPLVQIVMAHSTLVGADDQPAELVGHG
ncbi:MAG TPA: DUF222 domain-containing protein, partial [Pseudonocardia sp.]